MLYITDIWKDGRMDEWTDRQTNGLLNAQTSFKFSLPYTNTIYVTDEWLVVATYNLQQNQVTDYDLCCDFIFQTIQCSLFFLFLVVGVGKV